MSSTEIVRNFELPPEGEIYPDTHFAAVMEEQREDAHTTALFHLGQNIAHTEAVGRLSETVSTINSSLESASDDNKLKLVLERDRKKKLQAEEQREADIALKNSVKEYAFWRGIDPKLITDPALTNQMDSPNESPVNVYRNEFDQFRAAHARSLKDPTNQKPKKEKPESQRHIVHVEPDLELSTSTMSGTENLLAAFMLSSAFNSVRYGHAGRKHGKRQSDDSENRRQLELIKKELNHQDIIEQIPAEQMKEIRRLALSEASRHLKALGSTNLLPVVINARTKHAFIDQFIGAFGSPEHSRERAANIELLKQIVKHNRAIDKNEITVKRLSGTKRAQMAEDLGQLTLEHL